MRAGFSAWRKNRAPRTCGNRYSRGPCEQVQTVNSLRLSGYDGYKSIDRGDIAYGA